MLQDPGVHTAALARHHARLGPRVRVFKTGPDFIDPMFLEAASGQPVYQLDLWMVGEDECRRRLYTADKPLVAECGGMLYLLDEPVGQGGHGARMCGVLSGRARMQARLTGIGLQSALFESGELRGHTFHHSVLETPLTPYAMGARHNWTSGEAVYRIGRLTASYLHWYLPSCPEATADLFRP
jgi:cobyrinic acid a,c-diamide synthase